MKIYWKSAKSQRYLGFQQIFFLSNSTVLKNKRGLLKINWTIKKVTGFYLKYNKYLKTKGLYSLKKCKFLLLFFSFLYFIGYYEYRI